MTVVQAEEERNYQILVYGIEKKGLSPPKQPIRTRIFTLHFDSNSRRKEKSQFTPWQKGEKVTFMVRGAAKLSAWDAPGSLIWLKTLASSRKKGKSIPAPPCWRL